MEYTHRVWIMYIIVFSLNFLTAERHLILGAAKLNQHIYFKGILTLKFESKDMLLWKRDSAFVSTEDENLWIPSKLMLFDGTRPPRKVSMYPKNTSPNKQQEAVWRKQHLNSKNDCL